MGREERPPVDLPLNFSRKVARVAISTCGELGSD